MTARNAAAIASLALLGATAACTNFYEVPIETPLQAKLDVSAFRRVLVAGFISGGSEDVDANMETVRLLRSQLRTKTNLRVIEAEVLPLAELFKQQDAGRANTDPLPAVADVGAQQGTQPAAGQQPPTQEGVAPIRSRKDLERYDRIFADAAFWKKLGEEYEQPLIITGTIMFTPQKRNFFIDSITNCIKITLIRDTGAKLHR